LLVRKRDTVQVKLEDFTLRQVGVAVALLALVDWAVCHFLLLPGMPEEQRRRLYSTLNPYLSALSLTFVAFALWFVFWYRGHLPTHKARLAMFALALGTLCGFLMIVVIRAT